MLQGDQGSGREPIGALRLRISSALDGALGLGALAVFVAWLVGSPILYRESAPVMSAFTAFSLFLMVAVRQARLHLDTWPMALGLAVTGLVLGGNVSSVLMLWIAPPELWAAFPGLVLTSVVTSLGLSLFCCYDFVVTLRDTPRSAFIVDDLLLHLALVPGALSLLGVLLGNPTYLSIHRDPRVGISTLEMGFMALYATVALVSNPRLFLWRFLREGWGNRLAFGALFANQFVAPLVVALVLAPRGVRGPGIEAYVMLAGVVATLAFLLLQARVEGRRPKAGAPAGAGQA